MALCVLQISALKVFKCSIYLNNALFRFGGFGDRLGVWLFKVRYVYGYTPPVVQLRPFVAACLPGVFSSSLTRTRPISSVISTIMTSCKLQLLDMHGFARNDAIKSFKVGTNQVTARSITNVSLQGLQQVDHQDVQIEALDKDGKKVAVFLLNSGRATELSRHIQLHKLKGHMVGTSDDNDAEDMVLWVRTYYDDGEEPPEDRKIDDSQEQTEQFIPQLAGPENALKAVNAVAPVTNSTLLGEAMVTITGPLPATEQHPKYQGYMYVNPAPLAEESKRGTGVQAPTACSCEWQNTSVEGYKAAFGEDAYAQNVLNDTPIIPGTSAQQDLALEASIQLLSLGFVRASAATGMRATHAHGIYVQGSLQMSAEFPGSHGEITENTGPLPVRIRHSTLHTQDEAGMDARGCALSINFPHGPLDLVMNSGDLCLFWNIPTVQDFSVLLGQGKLREYVRKYPAGYYALADTMRRAPPSYFQLSYGTKIPYESNGKLYRFRVTPNGRATKPSSQDPGMPDKEDLRRIWDFKRRDNENRPENYLSEEARSWFSDGRQTVMKEGDSTYKVLSLDTAVEVYSLEFQCVKMPDDDSKRDLYNPARPWTADWCQLGVIKVDTLLSSQQMRLAQYSPGRIPKSFDLSLPKAIGPTDYNSVGIARKAIYSKAAAVRTAATVSC